VPETPLGCLCINVDTGVFDVDFDGIDDNFDCDFVYCYDFDADDWDDFDEDDWDDHDWERSVHWDD
jgi:hypothetical protein